MDRRWMGPGALLLLGGAVWYTWSNQGRAHNVTLRDAAGQSYDPYAFWGHFGRQDLIRHYPERVAPACLNMPLELQDGAYSTRTGATPYA